MDKPVSLPGNNGRTPEFPTQALKAEYLSLIDVFRELPTEEITRLAAKLPMRTFSAGGVIYAPGAPSEVLFLLKRGTVNIVQQVPGGKCLITEVLQPYTFFGEMALVGERVPDWTSLRRRSIASANSWMISPARAATICAPKISPLPRWTTLIKLFKSWPVTARST
jgi:CRP-like cAMP-binding protein